MDLKYLQNNDRNFTCLGTKKLRASFQYLKNSFAYFWRWFDYFNIKYFLEPAGFDVTRNADSYCYRRLVGSTFLCFFICSVYSTLEG